MLFLCLLPTHSLAQPTNTLFVQQAYRDLLGREADPSALVNFVLQLTSGSLSRTQVATTLLSSDEYRGDRVREFYLDFLGRSPALAEVPPLVVILNSSPLAVGRGIILDSSEYLALSGGTNAAFLSALFLDLLHRPIDPAASTALQAQLQSGAAHLDIALAVQSSDEWRRLIIDDYYQQFLGRPADPASLNVFANALQVGASEQSVIAAIVGSNEYFQRLPEPSTLALLPFAAFACLRRRTRR